MRFFSPGCVVRCPTKRATMGNEPTVRNDSDTVGTQSLQKLLSDNTLRQLDRFNLRIRFLTAKHTAMRSNNSTNAAQWSTCARALLRLFAYKRLQKTDRSRCTILTLEQCRKTWHDTCSTRVKGTSYGLLCASPRHKTTKSTKPCKCDLLAC